MRIIAIRADMDCLPMEEGSTLPYRSKNPGRSHSCGHDGHTASALGTALLLHRRRAALPSNCVVRFLFQVGWLPPCAAAVCCCCCVASVHVRVIEPTLF